MDRKETEYVVVYHHEYGDTIFIVRSGHVPTEQEIVKALDLHFEPEKDEYLTIDAVFFKNVIDI